MLSPTPPSTDKNPLPVNENFIWLHQTLPTTRMGAHEWIRFRDARLSSTMRARINSVFKVLTGMPSGKQESRGYWVSLTHHEFTMNYYRVIKDTGIPLIVRYKTTTGFWSALSNKRKLSTLSIKHTRYSGRRTRAV
jgi:hypothetical protein